MDYRHMVRSVVRDVDFLNYVPFSHWIDYPAMAALTVRGCKHNCSYCGGSAFASRLISGRTAPAYRSPERLAEDVRRMYNVSRGPAFILGDLRQAGMDYARRFLRAIRGYPGQGMLEIFTPMSREFAQELAGALPNFVIEFSPESHDPAVRRALNMNYSNAEIEETIEVCLDVGCRRFDLFFMIGLSQQTPASALETVDYCRSLLKQFDDGRLIPFTSPLAPFLDPGSRAYEQPDRFGYIRHASTLADHRELLLQPTWRDILSYETHWMDRQSIVDVTYEAGYRLNRLKREAGLVSTAMAEETESRIQAARGLMQEIDHLVATKSVEELDAALMVLKPRIDQANTSTVCDKEELDAPVGLVPFKIINLARIGLGLESADESAD
jgi:B12-binding domain/radical SAM domain protein